MAAGVRPGGLARRPRAQTRRRAASSGAPICVQVAASCVLAVLGVRPPRSSRDRPDGSLEAELERIAAAALAHAGPGEQLAGVIPTEPAAGRRVYLCAFDGRGRTWLALDDEARPVHDRARLRSAVSIAAFCELAEEVAGGGKLDELRAELADLRERENPDGIDEAERAALELDQTMARTPRLASPAYLDEIGLATRRLEQALGEGPVSPFAETMKAATSVAGELEREVLGGYKVPLR